VHTYVGFTTEVLYQQGQMVIVQFKRQSGPGRFKVINDIGAITVGIKTSKDNQKPFVGFNDKTGDGLVGPG